DPWEVHIQKNIFNPLGMSRSYFGYTPWYLKDHRSRAYVVRKDAEGKIVVDDSDGEFNPAITNPNGGWNSPISDAVAYIAFLTGSTGADTSKQRLYDTVLSRSTLEEMWRPRHPQGDAGALIGLGFFLYQEGPQR